MGSMWDVASKEVSDSFSSKKFLGMVVLFTLFSMGAVFMGFKDYQMKMDQFQSGGWVPEKPTLLDIFNFMMGFNMPIAAGGLAIAFSYAAISDERSEGTIELLLSYPVYRDEIINGKFIARIFSLGFALLLAFLASSGLTIYLTDTLPTMNQVIRLSFVWIGTIVYMGFFTALGTLFSTLLRSRWRALGLSIFILLLSLATPLMAQIAASQIYQYDATAGTQMRETRTTPNGITVVEESDDRRISREEVRRQRDRFKQKVSRLSPTTAYQSFTSTMLLQTAGNEIDPTVSESIDNAIGYLIFLISETILMFTASYTVFMRQDL
ncbi:ABC transporter permease [Candidatus Nanohalobium constans]|uniref:ABC-2 type transport system permease protein n=1 Tax=Candidatus Nanohalobium constans TaxID=2565781 RepID=A0A5Q0UGA1_9ARCH|nr:ABC transporter permease subunit [Candidatus Nanohalobium constans]QGA80648.1 ABC-2 type transport system permease protein [Candidatus Nanohalobium constans]